MNLIDVIEQEMRADDADRELQSAKLMELYGTSSAVQRKAIDDALICLCGWGYPSLKRTAALH